MYRRQPKSKMVMPRSELQITQAQMYKQHGHQENDYMHRSLLQRSPARHGEQLGGEELVGERNVRTRGVPEDGEAARKPQHLSRLASTKIRASRVAGGWVKGDVGACDPKWPQYHLHPLPLRC